MDECLERADLTRRFVEEDLRRLNWNERRAACRYSCVSLDVFSNFMRLTKTLLVVKYFIHSAHLGGNVDGIKVIPSRSLGKAYQSVCCKVMSGRDHNGKWKNNITLGSNRQWQNKIITHIVLFDRDVNTALECMMRSTNLTCSDPFASYARPIFHFVEYDLAHGCSGDKKVIFLQFPFLVLILLFANVYV